MSFKQCVNGHIFIPYEIQQFYILPFNGLKSQIKVIILTQFAIFIYQFDHKSFNFQFINSFIYQINKKMVI